jgi:alkanesulfonate monooxygenase SsuD/methylene tetrahydromethanopterin reductase-like flavin-dependent oxidoreductase (luciferase family)
VAAQIDFPSRIGVWWTSDTWSMPDARQAARDIEAMGYGSLFYGEAYGKETLTQAGAFLAATERLVVGTGIANIHARDPIAAESGARTLTALHPGRFVLGLGVSHAHWSSAAGEARTRSRWPRCATTSRGWPRSPSRSSPAWAVPPVSSPPSAPR